MDPQTRRRLMAEARSEAELSWNEGGIPVGAVLAREDGTVVACGHNCRVQAGIQVDCLDDPECVALMTRMQQERPDQWREDIGLPPA